MADPSNPTPPSSLPTFSDVFFRRLFIPIVISFVMLAFIFVMISVPTDIPDQTYIGGGLKNLLSIKKK